MPLPKDEPSRVPVVVPDPTQAACAIGPDVRSLGVRNGPPPQRDQLTLWP
jgi:hypothetical protein